jgi:DNA-binding MarR family transcriptional regulator
MDTSQKIIAALERIGQSLRSLLLSHAFAEGLSVTQSQLLLQCYLQPGRLYTVSELAAELDLTQPTVSDAISALQRKGLLQKLQREDDRRAVAVALTPRGRALARRLWQQHTQRFEDVIARFSAEEQALLLHLLLRFIAYAYESGVLQSTRTCPTCRFFVRRQSESGTSYFCALLEQPLTLTDLRVLCPDHEPISTA